MLYEIHDLSSNHLNGNEEVNKSPMLSEGAVLWCCRISREVRHFLFGRQLFPDNQKNSQNEFQFVELRNETEFVFRVELSLTFKFILI